jgi:hypothetical protein
VMNVVMPSVFHQQEGHHQEPFFKDVLCVGCHEQTVWAGKHARQSCGSLIYKQQQQHGNKKDLVQATQSVLALFNGTTAKECHLCHPNACVYNNKHYYCPDIIAPHVVYAKTLYLPSIPEQHRVLLNPQVINWMMYFSNTSNVHPHHTYFFEYNPSIVQIPKSQIPLSALMPDQAADVVYLALFCIANTQQCVHGDNEL